MFFEILFKINAMWHCQSRVLIKKTSKILVYPLFFWQMLLIFKSSEWSGTFSLYFCLWKNICLVLPAFRDNLFIELHSFMTSLLAISRIFCVTMQRKTLVSSANIIEWSIFFAYCRSFTQIRKSGGPSTDHCGAKHLMVSEEAFSSP